MINTSVVDRLIALILLGLLNTSSVGAQQNSTQNEQVFSGTSVDAAKRSLANVFAGLIEQGIPREYEKHKDWGKTKNLTVGLRADGLKIHRRKKPVKHGVWKHYQVRQVGADKNLDVRIENLRAIDGGRAAFKLIVVGKLDAWARAKVYHYGVHLIALEVVADTDFEIKLDCEVGVRLQTKSGSPGLALEPRVTDAQTAFANFQIRRVSNAKGPLVRELSSGVRELIEKELQGPKLVAKLNRSIDKKRDRLEFDAGELLDSSWWPLAELHDVQHGIQAARR